MKKILLLLSMLYIASVALSQEGRMCNAEALATKADAAIQKDYINISKINEMSISVETITDLTNNKQLKALEMECPVPADNKSTIKTVLLDPDEVDALITFMNNMTDNYFKQPAPTSDKEFSFTSKSGLEAGAYWDHGWKVYVKIDSDDGRTNRELNRDDVMAFVSFLKQAKTRM
jgi:hypothetical protein